MCRAHSLVLSAGADSAARLAGELRLLADRIERGEVSNGRTTSAEAEITVVYARRRERTAENCLPGADAWPERGGS